MLTLDQYNKLKFQADEAKRQEAKLTGSLESVERRLKDEYGCKTMKDAKTLLTSMERELEDEEKGLERMQKEFEAKWNDKL